MSAKDKLWLCLLIVPLLFCIPLVNKIKNRAIKITVHYVLAFSAVSLSWFLDVAPLLLIAAASMGLLLLLWYLIKGNYNL